MPEDLLRKYRPVGPPADLRARVLVPERAAWPWAVAAAALFAIIAGFHGATRTLGHAIDVARPPTIEPATRVAHITDELGGGELARREATLIVLEEEIERRLPPVTAAGVPRQ